MIASHWSILIILASHWSILIILASHWSILSATPEMTRKHPAGNINNLADDEASDTENELR